MVVPRYLHFRNCVGDCGDDLHPQTVSSPRAMSIAAYENSRGFPGLTPPPPPPPHTHSHQALVMQYYRRGSLARAMRTLWYQDLTDVQRLRYGVQVSWGARVGCGQQH
jgi:hypothetical protein